MPIAPIPRLISRLPLTPRLPSHPRAHQHPNPAPPRPRQVYTKQDVDKLRGSIKIEHTLARLGAERLWKLLHSEPYIHALGALTGNQAVQQVQAGLKVSGLASRQRGVGCVVVVCGGVWWWLRCRALCARVRCALCVAFLRARFD